MRRLNITNDFRGSVEIILLIIVLVAIAALVAWRITAPMWEPKEELSQSEQIEQDVAEKGRSLAGPLNISFKVPDGHGDIITTDPQGGKYPSVTLLSSKLEKAEYTCKGENKGVFGTLALDDPEDFGPQPQFTKKIDENTYGFTSSLSKACYNAELLKEFRETVPAAIVESLEEINPKSDEEKAEKTDEAKEKG